MSQLSVYKVILKFKKHKNDALYNLFLAANKRETNVVIWCCHLTHLS